jgi:transcription antitermination factor NusG
MEVASDSGYYLASFSDSGVVDGPPPVASNRGFAPRFTRQRNPFLYPLGLLDAPLRHRVAGDKSDCPAIGQSDVADTPPRWLVVHTKPRQEKKLAQELARSEVPHFLPATQAKSVTRGRTLLTWSPLFASYLFLHSNTEQRLAALKTNRIVSCIEVEDQSTMRQQLWDLADLIEKEVPLRIEERITAGQQVRVKSGPLKDKVGIVIKRSNDTRLFLRVHGLLGGVSLSIEQHLLEVC